MKNPTWIFFILLFVLLGGTTWITCRWTILQAKPSQQVRLKRLFFYSNLLCIAGLAGGKLLSLGNAFSGYALQVLVLWFAWQLLMAAFFLLWRLGGRFCGRGTAYDPQRRIWLKSAFWLPAAAGALSIYGGLEESQQIEEVHIPLQIENLPEVADHFRIAQLSDVHLGYFFSLTRLQQVLDQIVMQKPDVLMVTGDLFDDVEANEEAVRILDAYVDAFPQGIYFCWGNHEYMRQPAKIERWLKKSRIKVLKGQADLLIGGEHPVYVLGVDYPLDRSKDQEQQCEDTLQSALADVPEESIKILMAHHSIFIEYAFQAQVDLTLSGHTHGGQIGFLGMPLFPLFKYTRGMYRQDHMYGYVNSGAGSWCPFRLGCPPEITYFTLQA